MMQIGSKQGMVMMEQSIRKLYEEGLISDNVAREFLAYGMEHDLIMQNTLKDTVVGNDQVYKEDDQF